LPLRELRALARREVLVLAGADGNATGPLLLAGHQPELSHPGVWVKNFALHAFAKKLDGIPLHLIADADTLKSTAIRFPVFRTGDAASVHLEPVAYDTFTGEVPYEDREISNTEQFQAFAEHVKPHWANWGYEPLLAKVWEQTPPLASNIGQIFTAMRRQRECAWGCCNRELGVSRLSRTQAFGRFARHILADLPRFRVAYNTAILAYRKANNIRSANHPAPELAEGEAPFWVRTSQDGRRERATPASDVHQLRPRALTLTLFARVCLGDFFIHGIGGGKYDEVTDAIIRDYFGIEPPAYQVMSATLHLPLPGFASTDDDVEQAARRVRDLYWNPQRHLPPGSASDLLASKTALAENEPPTTDHAARKAWFRALQLATERLRPRVAAQLPEAEVELEHLRVEVAANGVLQRRDYPWVLYPEATLRPFLQRFLNGVP